MLFIVIIFLSINMIIIDNNYCYYTYTHVYMIRNITSPTASRRGCRILPTPPRCGRLCPRCCLEKTLSVRWGQLLLVASNMACAGSHGAWLDIPSGYD